MINSFADGSLLSLLHIKRLWISSEVAVVAAGLGAAHTLATSMFTERV